ncbi:helix-turn-helix transcriptional regulator [Hymenobacter sp. BT664]|uniref:Helix-turn-helix transcriptional regulator n=1 Tax=Hymenobacter montanus TaxID=2771359 RepID=A0A927GHX7_9BACT|nr:helix-turn-helix transcriptional regulator [Hymenobacter montanus]MBD2766481.1 helix-turn-helix transcriptional regulator [Hymenobacter montanus]
MSQETINQRLNFLIKSLGLSIRAFSAALGVSDTNTRNYLSKGTKPNSDYLESILRHFNRVNPAWLITGEGEPFLTEPSASDEPLVSYQKNNSGQRPGPIPGSTIGRGYGLADCERERDTYKAERDLARQEALSLREQLAMKDQLIAAKDEMLSLLRTGFNRSN